MAAREIQMICKEVDCGSTRGEIHTINIGGVELIVALCPRHARQAGLKHNVVYHF